jgi:benzoyl-CoA reductase subunit B
MAEKQLDCTRAASEHQKAGFVQLREDVFEKQRPYAIIQADMPFELFHVMEVPVVSNQWWAAIISAKRLSGYYLDTLNSLGFHGGLCRYCSLAAASTMTDDPERAPWGGLPKPALLCARLTCDCLQRVFAIWAEAFDTECFFLDNPGATHLPPRWWELSRHHWRELFEAHRLKFTVLQFQNLIRKLERITGRQFQIDRLHDRMERVNRQEEYFEEACRMICDAPRVPVRMNEQVTNVMAAQWERGSDWAVEHARAFRDEIRNRVKQGVAACPGERLRLMWVGAGIWHDTDFYTAFEEEFGAVFVWSMYLAFGPDGYIRYGLDDPLLALASRNVSMNEQLHNPPWANEWIVHQARLHRIDAALVLTPLGTRPAVSGNRFIERALEHAGIPVLPVIADMVDARDWDPGAMRREVSVFLRRRVLPHLNNVRRHS